MRPTPNPSSGAQPTWKHGTDLRDDATGVYQWPHPALAGETPITYYPSVTTILDEFTGSGMLMAANYFIAQYVHDLAAATKEKRPVEVWLDADNKDGGEVVEVNPLDLLMNRLGVPLLDETGKPYSPNRTADGYPVNFGTHWIKNSGFRELRRRANRGSILHDVMEEWAYGMRVDTSDAHDYAITLIQAKGFRIEADYVTPYIITLLDWLNDNVREVYMAEAVVMNDTYGYAGTLDTVLELRSDMMSGVGIMDAKGSKGDQPSHELQGAAYFHAETVGIGGTADRVEFPGNVEWFANLYVQPEKATFRVWPRVRRCKDHHECEPFRAFLHARVLWQELYAPEHPKTVKAPKSKQISGADTTLPSKLADKLAQGSLEGLA